MDILPFPSSATATELRFNILHSDHKPMEALSDLLASVVTAAFLSEEPSYSITPYLTLLLFPSSYLRPKAASTFASS